MDIVIFKRDYPRLDFGGGISGFLAESVVATIEIKSLLTKEELQNATVAARNTKALSRDIITAFTTGYHPPAILNFVVAYDGPATMRTVHGWLPEITAATGIAYSIPPSDPQRRAEIPSAALDAVFVLCRGCMHYANAPFGFIPDEVVARLPNVEVGGCRLTERKPAPAVHAAHYGC